jgi:glucosamine--fructose-6-phosphate aminotransferase (isomerizing)
MCGVFGFASFDGKGPNIKRLADIAKVTQRRGPHAFGFSWVDGQGRLRMFKQSGRISDYLGVLAVAHDARLLIGHCRYATHGAPSNNLNNHPHPADGGWIVHNGVIGRHEEIARHRELLQVTECDSEVLGLLIEQGKSSLLRRRCVDAVQEVSGSPLVMLGLWSRPGRLIAIRDGNPLSLGLCNGRAYLGSLADGLPGKVVEVEDQSGLDIGASAIKSFTFKRASMDAPNAIAVQKENGLWVN